MKKTGEVVDNRYFALVREFPLIALSSEKEYDRAIEIINGLVARGFDKLTPGEDAYLDVLSDIVEKYENEHHPIPESSPLDVLRFFIEDRQTNQRTIALGSGIAVSTMSDILAGRRPLNLVHIRKLANYLGVAVGVFLPADGDAQTVAARKAPAVRVAAKK